MVIYDSQANICFREFGIDIPQALSRARRIVDALLADSELAREKGKWLIEGVGVEATPEDIALAHARGYVETLFGPRPEPVLRSVYELNEQGGDAKRHKPEIATRSMQELARRVLVNASGACRATREALVHGFAYFAGGGMHHAMWAGGRGFCPVNDIVVALRKLRVEGRIGRAWVIDLDAHKGDGTAELCLDDPDTRTLSIHMARGWPLDEPPFANNGTKRTMRASMAPSTIDIGVDEGREDRYLPCLARGLRLLEEMSRGEAPDIAVVVAGSDPYEHDELPGARLLRLTLDQMRERDVMTHEFLRDIETPQAWVMSGGYGERAHEPPAAFLTLALQKRLKTKTKSERR